VVGKSKSSAENRNRTRDIFITSEALYQLSYFGVLFFFLSFLKKDSTFKMKSLIASYSGRPLYILAVAIANVKNLLAKGL